MGYCKWHNATSHDTNDCKLFHQQIQLAIKQGRLKFETPKKSMKIDQHPFLRIWWISAKKESAPNQGADVTIG